MLVDLLMFVLLVLFAPYILVGVVLAKILVEADKIFRLPMLGAGVSLAGLSAIGGCTRRQTRKPNFSQSWRSSRKLVRLESRCHTCALRWPPDSSPHRSAGAAQLPRDRRRRSVRRFGGRAGGSRISRGTSYVR